MKVYNAVRLPSHSSLSRPVPSSSENPSIITALHSAISAELTFIPLTNGASVPKISIDAMNMLRCLAVVLRGICFLLSAGGSVDQVVSLPQS